MFLVTKRAINPAINTKKKNKEDPREKVCFESTFVVVLPTVIKSDGFR